MPSISNCRLGLGLGAMIIAAAAACGSVENKDIDAAIDASGAIDAPAIDAATIDAPTIDAATIDAPAIDARVIDAPAIDARVIDAPAIDARVIDAAVDASIDAPGCAWITISQCDTGGTIAQFCPPGTHVNQLRRCNGTTYTPDQTYQQYHLCNCNFSQCGCSGVAWQQVECCN